MAVSQSHDGPSGFLPCNPEGEREGGREKEEGGREKQMKGEKIWKIIFITREQQIITMQCS